MLEADDRLKKEIGASRRSRAADDRSVTERRDISDNDRLQMFRNSRFNDVLPDLPEIPGYHVCWLTTTNPRDSIHLRQSWGYTPITNADIPGLDYLTLKTGEYAGMVGVNEMLAFKVPLDLYYGMMQIKHHDDPNEEEGRLAERADQMQRDAVSSGTSVEEEEGFQELRNSRPARGRFDP